MIDGRDNLFDRIRAFNWKPTPQSYEAKLRWLDVQINEAVRGVGTRVIEKEPRVHLAFSGGVDSTLLLYKLVDRGFPVTVHTMVATEDNPDLVYARKAVAAVNGDIHHRVHFRAVTPDDVRRSNRILGTESGRPDNYLLLMEALSGYTQEVVCGDCIDELLGGYYRHSEGTPEVFRELLDGLIPNHLVPLDRCSSHAQIRVHLPYATRAVMAACSEFAFDELVGEQTRKRPVCDLARREGVPLGNIGRRKRGLVSALEAAPQGVC